ncbi:hypothetical protein BJ138DRAFT_1010278 [Hygrophoropsis aurantiaca]|uniref:Uncharacterized protein n=1 Tax=Hygrophoropsis aurantiaca TaxID=72124 RepID=A0ACB8A8I1_9AGAM|nr:hypothetical protein BJ138DRAFT_1010278 [Hygrophoropsis aurantiaca]
MFHNLSHLLGPVRNTRFYSQLIAATRESPATVFTAKEASQVRYPYFLRRNTRGSLPVFTDVRNGGTKHLVLIRNVEGQITMLANELQQSLFKRGSPEASRLKVEIIAQRHLALSGGRWKNDVMKWLMAKGF